MNKVVSLYCRLCTSSKALLEALGEQDMSI